MPSQIPFDKLQGNELTPAVAVETNLTAGLSALPDQTKTILFVGAKLSAGSVSEGEIKKITSDAEADSYFGAGSRLAGMIRAANRVAPRVPKYAMAQPEGTTAAGPTGGGTGKVTISGSTATAAGTLSITVGGRSYTIGVAVGDTAGEVQDAIVAAINSDPHRYVEASEATADVALNARNKGPEGNTINLRVLTLGADGLTFAASGAYLTGGATYGAFSFANAEVQRFEIVCIDSNDPTATTGNFAKAIKHVEDMSEPMQKKWGMTIAGSGTDGSTAATLAALGTNSYRAQVVHLASAECPCWELAGAFAGERARVVDSGESLDYHALSGILTPYAKKDWTTEAEIEAALQAGITPLRPRLDGTVEVVRSIVTRKTAPIAYVDHNPTEISDYVDADLINQFTLKHLGKKLKSLSAPGTPNTVTPKRALQLLHSRMRIWDANDLVEGADLDIEAGRTAAEINAQNPNRLDLAFPFRPIYRAHQIYILKTLTTPDFV